MADTILILQFNRGKKEAFDQIYKRFYLPIFDYANKFVSAEDAADIIQDVFFKLYEAKKDFKAIGNVKAWLLTSARNAVTDKFRKEQLKIAAQIELANRMSAETPDWLDKKEHIALQSEYLRLIYEYIDELPDYKQQIFKLAFIGRLKNAEVAQRVGLTEDKVSRYKKSIMRHLRTLFSEREIAVALFVLTLNQ